MRTNPFYDSWQFLLGQTGDHNSAGPIVAWLLTLLFPALLVASAWIARQNWLEDPSQRTSEHVATWLMRVLIGCMWFQGSLWKLPLPVSGGLVYWTGQMAEFAAYDVHKWIVTNVLLPSLPVLNTFIFLTEFGLGISFIVGVLVRPMAVIGMLFTLQLWLGLYRHPGEWPWLYIFLVFVQGMFLIHNAGRSLGLDGLLARKTLPLLAGDGALATFYRRFA